MYRKSLLLLFLLFGSTLSLNSCKPSKVIFGEPSNDEISYALRKVLNSSTLKMINGLSTLSTQGVEGLLPEEFQDVLGVLKSTGAIKDIDKVEAKIADISKEVGVETSETLKDAIKELSFKDGAAIVLGGKEAATHVLKNAMYTTVQKRYSDRLNQELTKIDPNINMYWAAGTSAYNLLSKNKIDSDMSDFLSKRAVDLMFASIGQNESSIRNNPMQLQDQIVNKVFDYFKNK